MELIWACFLPIVFIVFGCVFGITINLKLPMMKWENEAAVVKQSASATIGGLGGCLVIILCAIPVVFVTGVIGELTKLVIAQSWRNYMVVIQDE